MTGRRVGGCGAAALLAASVAAVLAVPSFGVDFDYADCRYSPATRTLSVTANDEEALVKRDGRRIVVLEPAGYGLREDDCGPQATIRNTDRIRYRIRAENITEGRLSLAGGPFAPGHTRERGRDEIEISIAALKQSDETRLEATKGADHFRAGGLGRVPGVDLNPDADARFPDADLRLTRVSRAGVSFRMGGGADTLELDGGPGFKGPLRLRAVGVFLGPGDDTYAGAIPTGYVWGGSGSDTITTGAGKDYILAFSGDDTIETGARADLVSLGGGRDIVSTGDGPDEVASFDGAIDEVDCGPGEDSVLSDPIDLVVNCEHVDHQPI